MFVDEKAAGEEAPIKVETLKLSEAIRIGATMKPQSRTGMFRENGTCAIGAAFDGAGLGAVGREYRRKNNCDPYFMFRDHFGVTGVLESEIWMRNDRGETREQIADWLAVQGY